MPCKGKRRDGKRCGANPLQGRDVCYFHADGPADRARRFEASARGGKGVVPPSAAPLAEAPGVGELDLETAVGVRGFLARTLRGLSQLPIDPKVAHAVAAVVNSQRATIETSDIEVRVKALETRDEEMDVTEHPEVQKFIANLAQVTRELYGEAGWQKLAARVMQPETPKE